MQDLLTIRIIVKKWVDSLIKQEVDYSLISKNFLFENGLELNEYIQSELNDYKDLCSHYDLNHIYDIKINSCIPINDNKIQVFYTIINSFDIPIFKWYLTLDVIDLNYFISSNNYFSQIVSKLRINYSIKENMTIISGVNLAIKTEGGYCLENIISKQISTNDIVKPTSFHEDGFLLVNCSDYNLQNVLIFKLIYSNNCLGKKNIENRKVFIDIENQLNKPFIIENNFLILRNEYYPFHLNILYANKEEENIYHPKNIKILLNNSIENITITDALDNDWVLK